MTRTVPPARTTETVRLQCDRCGTIRDARIIQTDGSTRPRPACPCGARSGTVLR